MRRLLARTAVSVFVGAAALVVPTPANAAVPIDVHLQCEPLGRSRVLCLATVTGGTPPRYVRWFRDGVAFPGFDDRYSSGWSCTQGLRQEYTVAVFDLDFEIDAATTTSGCVTGNP